MELRGVFADEEAAGEEADVRVLREWVVWDGTDVVGWDLARECMG